MAYEQHIKTGTDLFEWFHLQNRRSKNFKHAIKTIWTGIYVSTEVRNEILLSVDAGKITLDGKVQQIAFQNMQGGLWRAHIYTQDKK